MALFGIQLSLADTNVHMQRYLNLRKLADSLSVHEAVNFRPNDGVYTDTEQLD